MRQSIGKKIKKRRHGTVQARSLRMVSLLVKREEKAPVVKQGAQDGGRPKELMGRPRERPRESDPRSLFDTWPSSGLHSAFHYLQAAYMLYLPDFTGDCCARISNGLGRPPGGGGEGTLCFYHTLSNNFQYEGLT